MKLERGTSFPPESAYAQVAAITTDFQTVLTQKDASPWSSGSSATPLGGLPRTSVSE